MEMHKTKCALEPVLSDLFSLVYTCPLSGTSATSPWSFFSSKVERRHSGLITEVIPGGSRACKLEDSLFNLNVPGGRARIRYFGQTVDWGFGRALAWAAAPFSHPPRPEPAAWL